MNLYFNNSIIDNNPINKNHYFYFDQMISNFYLSNSNLFYPSNQIPSNISSYLLPNNNYSKCSLYNISNSSEKIDINNLKDISNKFTYNSTVNIDLPKNKIKESLSVKNIRRCGVIFIKDFVDDKQTLINTDKNRDKNRDKIYYNDQMIYKLRKLLIVKGKSGIWSLPKGRMNSINDSNGNNNSENEYECASREAYEETGIYINPLLLEKLPKIKINRNTYFIMDLNNILFNNGKLGLYIKSLDLVYNFNEPLYNFINFSDYNNINKMDTFEIDEIDWKTIDEITNLRCNKDIRNLLKKLKIKT
jgi:8-oxo-dGTP pyrophosphatase MutT (NUDIX family)